MPIPKPKPGEKKDDFISRCMGDKVMNKDYPDNKQRSAVCYKQTEGSNKNNKEEKGYFVSKDEDKRLVTGAVAVPDCPDCDFDRGEELLTVDKIESMVHYFNSKSRMSDNQHIYGTTGETIGDAVENWTSKEVMTVTNINGQTITFPVGTWMATVKITDDNTWNDIKEGKLRGFSAMYLPKKDADALLASKRGLIADLEDPVPVTISVVDNPCVYEAIFFSIKEKEDGNILKAGRTISDKTLKALRDAYDAIGNLMNVADGERNTLTLKKESKEDINMEREELIEIIGKEMDNKLEAFKKDLDEAWKAQEQEQEEEEEQEDTEAQKELEALKKEVEELKEKLGEPVPSKADKGQDNTPEKETVYKGQFKDRDAFGRKHIV